MKEKLVALVKENTKRGSFRKNHAMELGKALGLSRNWISQHLNELYTDHTFIKINTRPVIFIDRKIMKEHYSIEIKQDLFTSYEDFQNLLTAYDKHDFQKLIGYDGSLRDVVNKCKASISYPPHGLPTLLHGPTGTGKSTIVDFMYEYGINHQILMPQVKYLHVNCSEYANNPELITAHLFGYKMVRLQVQTRIA